MSKIKNRPSQSKWTWKKDFPLLGIFGTLLIFLSWIFQNQYANKATEERLHLEKTQQIIDLQQIRMEQWLIVYNLEKEKEKPSDKILLTASFKTLQSYLNLIAWSSARIDENDTKAMESIEQKNKVADNLKNHFANGDLKSLETDLLTAIAIAITNKTNFVEIATEKFNEKYSKITSKENQYTLLFILLFIIGSVLTGMDFMNKLKNSRVANVA